MSYWENSNITNIYTGTKPNDGQGDVIRDAFIKVDNNFGNISSFLSGTQPSFLNAVVQFNLATNYATVTNLFVSNSTGTISSITGNSTVGNLIANTGIYSPTSTFLSGNTYSNGNLELRGTTTVYDNFIPFGNAVTDLGSTSNFFRNIYAQTLITSQQVSVASDAGILSLHANLSPGDVKDVGILGKFDELGSNAYAFFGFQETTNNFIYKITPTDSTLGNSVVYDGVYGNAHLGSLFLSNTTTSSANTLVVAGDTNNVGNLFVAGNIYAAGNAEIATATIQNVTVTGEVLGNLSVTGTVYQAGSPLLSVNTAGPYNMFSGGIVLGNLLLPATYDAVSKTSAAVVVVGGIGVGANVNAGGLVGPYYGTVQTANQPLITGLGSLGNLTVVGQIQASQLQATSLGVTTITSTSINTGDITIGGATIVGGGAGSISAGTIGNVTSTIFGNTITVSTLNTTGVTATTVNAGAITGNIVSTQGNFNTIIANVVNARIIGNAGATLTGTLSTNAQPNITTVGTLANLTTSGTTSLVGTATLNGVALATLGGTASFSSINGTPIGNVLPSTGVFTTIGGTVSTAAQPNITSIGAAGLTVAGNTAINNTVYGRGIYDNGNRVLSTSNGAGNLLISGTSVTLPLSGPGATGAGSSTNIPVLQFDAYGRISTISTQTVSTSFGVAGTSGTSSVTSAGILTGVLSFGSTNGMSAVATVANSTSTTVTISTPQDLRTTAAPTFSGITPLANVAHNLGSSTLWWNNVYGNSIHALYADLAEKYTSDVDYEPGTVVVFGGDAEITVTMEEGDERVAGVVSTNPAYLMNDGIDGVAVALRGRVPVRVIGPVHKGDSLITSSTPGVAVSIGRDRRYGQAVFAKAIETDTTEGLKIITAVIL